MRGNFRIFGLRFRRTWPLMLLVSAIATAAAVLCDQFELLGIKDAEIGYYDQGLTTFTKNEQRRPDNPLWRLLATPVPTKAKSKSVVVVRIDDFTFQSVSQTPWMAKNFGSWPYSRNVWAWVLEHLAKQGAKAVVLDAVIDERHTDPAGDIAFGEAIGNTGLVFGTGVNALPKTPLPKVDARNRLPKKREPAKAQAAAPDANEQFDAPADEQFGEEPAGAQPAGSYPSVTDKEAAEAIAFPVVAHGINVPKLVDASADPPRALHPLPPIAPLIPVTSAFGLVQAEQDDDGKMRRTHFAFTDGENTYVTLSVAVAADVLGADQLELFPGRLKLGKREMMINPDGTAEIDYGGLIDERFDSVSLFQVLNDAAHLKNAEKTEIPDGFFKDKVVLIAGYAAGTADFRPTPFTSNSPAGVKHAAEIDSLLSGRFITTAPYWVSVLLTFLVAFFSVMIITCFNSIFLEIGWPLVLAFGFFAVTGLFLVQTNVHVLSAMPLWAGEVASVVGVALNHLLATNRERERLKEAFSHYMDHHLVEEVAERKRLPELAGETREVTVLSSGMRDFARVAEKCRGDPKALFGILNRYLTEITRVLFEHGGCVCEYRRDAVVCLFGAPVRDPAHALLACRAALEMQKESKKLEEALAKEGYPAISTCIGINTGTLFLGNRGSKQRMEYTAVGEGMTLVTRFQRANDAYGSGILAGPRTYELARTSFDLRELDRIRVSPAGGGGVSIYELLCPAGELPPPKQKGLELYAQGLSLYRERRFAEAIEPLSQAVALDTNDAPSAVLLGRCERFNRAAPANFDAITDLRSADASGPLKGAESWSG